MAALTRWFHNQYISIVQYDEVSDPVERIKIELHVKDLFWTFICMFVRGAIDPLVAPNKTPVDRLLFNTWTIISFLCIFVARLKMTKWLGLSYCTFTIGLVYVYAKLNPQNTLVIAIFGLIFPNFFAFLSQSNKFAVLGALGGLFISINIGADARTFLQANGANDVILNFYDKSNKAMFGFVLFNLIFTVLIDRKFDKILSCCTQHHQEAEKVKAETQILQEKNLFFSCFSHELRNPLNCILGSIDYAIKYTSDDVITDILSSGKMCGDLLINLINNILDLGKLDSKNLSLNETAKDSKSFIRNTWKITQELLKKKKIQGEVFVSRNFPSTILIDESRLTQVLVNLISNAAKFTDTNGSIRVIFSAEYTRVGPEECTYTTSLNHVASIPSQDKAERKFIHMSSITSPLASPCTSPRSTRSRSVRKSMDFVNQTADTLSSKHVLLYSSYRSDDQAAEWLPKTQVCYQAKVNRLKIEVIDSGCGMTGEECNKLFQPFVQANNSISGKYGGTGLGLYISKSIIDLMKGNISVVSLKGVGSCFMTAFPQDIYQITGLSSETEMKRNALGSAFKIIIDNHDDSLVSSILAKFEKRDDFNIKVRHENQKIESQKASTTYILVFRIKEINLDQINYLNPPSSQHLNNEKVIEIYYTKENPQHSWDPIKLKDQIVFTKLEDINNFIEARTIEITQKIKSSSGILIVDDDEFNRKVLSVFLKKEGYNIFFAENGQLGFEEFCRNQDKIDLVMVDYEMPILDGPGCAKKILAYLKENSKRAVPVYTLTGNISQETKQVALDSGVSKVFTKPAKMEVIVKAIFEDVRMRKMSITENK